MTGARLLAQGSIDALGGRKICLQVAVQGRSKVKTQGDWMEESTRIEGWS